MVPEHKMLMFTLFVMFLLQVVAPPQKPTKSTAGNKTSTKSSHKAKNNTSNASNSSRSKNDFVPPAFTKPSRRISATLLSLGDKDKKYVREGYYKNSDEAASRRPSSRATESSKATEKDTSSINTDSTRSSSVSGTTLQQDEKQTNEEQPVRNGGPQTVQMSTGNLEVIYGKPTTNAEYSKPRPTILANNKYPVPNNMRQFLTEYPSDDEKKDKK